MTAGLEASQFDLRRYFSILWRRRFLVAAVVLLGLASSLIVSWRQEPLYQGEAKVLLTRRSTEAVFSPQPEGGAEPARLVKNEMEVVKSEPVAAAVRAQLGPTGKVSVSQVGETDVIKIKGRSRDRDRAAVVAKAYATAYVEFRRTQALQDLATATRGVEGKIDELQRQIDGLDRQIAEVVDKQIAAALTQARAENPQAVDPSQYIRSEPVAGLSARRDQLLSQQSVLKQRLDELQLEAGLQSGGAELVTTTAIPTFDVTPNPMRTAVVALVLAMVLGVSLALLLEYMDDSIKTKEELDRLIPDLPVLGMAPQIAKWKDTDRPFLVTLADPSSPAAEAYRSLRASLQFIGVERAPRVFQITSAHAGDGKSSVASNLAVVLARAGKRVVLVDCDLRRARLHEFFDVPSASGFSTVFVKATTLDEAVRPVAPVENLFLIPAGPLPPNPSELLSSTRTAEIFAELQSQYDMVVVDCPPVLPVADAISLSAWVDATLLVVAAGTTTRKDLRRTLELLRQAEAALAGTVLNRVTTETMYGYPYEYKQKPAASGRAGAPRAVDEDDVEAAAKAANGQAGGQGSPAGRPERQSDEAPERLSR